MLIFYWVNVKKVVLKRRNKSNFALWRIGNVGGALSYAAPPRMSQKKRESLSWYSLLRGAIRNRNPSSSGCISLLFRIALTAISSYCSTVRLPRSAHRGSGWFLAGKDTDFGGEIIYIPFVSLNIQQKLPNFIIYGWWSNIIIFDTQFGCHSICINKVHYFFGIYYTLI